MLGQAAELPEPRFDKRKEPFNLVDMDSIGRDVRLVVDNNSVSILHLSIRLEAISPDLSQRLGEVFSFLYYWVKVCFVTDAKLAVNNP